MVLESLKQVVTFIALCEPRRVPSAFAAHPQIAEGSVSLLLRTRHGFSAVPNILVAMLG